MNPVYKLLGYVMPTRMKRIVVMSSLLGSITKKKELDSVTLEKVNDLVNICDMHTAICFPMMYSKISWNDEVVHDTTQVGKNLNESDLRKQTATKIIKMIPNWLKYEEESMERDITDMLARRDDIIGVTGS